MADNDMDSLLARHKREQKALTSQITSLKKTVTKGEKSKRKEVLAQVERLEKDLKERHQREFDEVNGQGQASKDVESICSELNNGDTSASADHVGLEKLKLDPAPLNEVKSEKPKVNRQKARMVCLCFLFVVDYV